MAGVIEAGRRLAGQVTHRLVSLPILVLQVHSACNCRCVMCDIWKANADKREISAEEMERHVDAIRRLHVQRVMLTGGEPLLHGNLWKLCERLRSEGIRITLVTTGLLVAPHAHSVAEYVDELVVSVDGPPDVHDRIRRVPGGFDRIAHGIGLLRNHSVRPRIVARSVVQRANHARLAHTVEAVRGIGVDRLSFLAADVSSAAFNRSEPWSEQRRGEVALSADQMTTLALAIGDVEARCREPLENGFIVNGIASLWRIHDYYSALVGTRDWPRIRCNAPWVSAVLEPGGQLRPCFFHPPYQIDPSQPLDTAINAPAAVTFRRSLRVDRDETCRRCVCSLHLAPGRDA